MPGKKRILCALGIHKFESYDYYDSFWIQFGGDLDPSKRRRCVRKNCGLIQEFYCDGAVCVASFGWENIEDVNK